MLCWFHLGFVVVAFVDDFYRMSIIEKGCSDELALRMSSYVLFVKGRQSQIYLAYNKLLLSDLR